MCSGLPYNDNYFTSNKNGVYSARHTVLFNLYSFDGLNSIAIITPNLQIINCEFKYFLSNTESLINIETDNVVYMTGNDVVSGADSVPYHFDYWGVDGGAVIKITNSTFRDSKFCKGLLVYRKQQAFTIADSPQVLNMTNLGLLQPTSKPSLVITDSKFTNLGFTETLDRVSIPSVVKEEGMQVQSVLWYNIFFNKGMVLNLQGWSGTIEIDNTEFSENMYNIPGLAY